MRVDEPIERLHPGPDGPPPEPDGVEVAGGDVAADGEVVAVDNKDAAADQLTQLGLRVRLKAADSDETKGDVIGVDPEVGTQVAADSVVVLTVSKGPQGRA